MIPGTFAATAARTKTPSNPPSVLVLPEAVVEDEDEVEVIAESEEDSDEDDFATTLVAEIEALEGEDDESEEEDDDGAGTCGHPEDRILQTEGRQRVVEDVGEGRDRNGEWGEQDREQDGDGHFELQPGQDARPHRQQGV